MTKLPRRYLAALGAIVLIAALWLLTWFGVPPFDNIQVFILTNVIGFFAILVLGVLGGAFVGLILAQRIFGAREFSPFERAVMESLAELKVRVEDIEKKLPPAERK